VSTVTDTPRRHVHRDTRGLCFEAGRPVPTTPPDIYVDAEPTPPGGGFDFAQLGLQALGWCERGRTAKDVALRVGVLSGLIANEDQIDTALKLGVSAGRVSQLQADLLAALRTNLKPPHRSAGGRQGDLRERT